MSDEAVSAFKFVSVFKWEFRKGWDVLVSAFARAFSTKDNVRARDKRCQARARRVPSCFRD